MIRTGRNYKQIKMASKKIQKKYSRYPKKQPEESQE